MWHKRKHSLFDMSRDHDLPVMSVVKAVAVSALVYQAAKYVIYGFMEDE
jgi:hypothetical protein